MRTLPEVFCVNTKVIDSVVGKVESTLDVPNLRVKDDVVTVIATNRVGSNTKTVKIQPYSKTNW